MWVTHRSGPTVNLAKASFISALPMSPEGNLSWFLFGCSIDISFVIYLYLVEIRNAFLQDISSKNVCFIDAMYTEEICDLNNNSVYVFFLFRRQ